METCTTERCDGFQEELLAEAGNEEFESVLLRLAARLTMINLTWTNTLGLPKSRLVTQSVEGL